MVSSFLNSGCDSFYEGDDESRKEIEIGMLNCRGVQNVKPHDENALKNVQENEKMTLNDS